MDAEVMPVSAVHTKKMLILDILEVLKRHTDAEHPMTQKEIIAALDLEYGLSVDRKAVKRNLEDLTDAGYPIRCGSETARTFIDLKTGETEENVMASDFYYEHDFSDGELRLLIDSLLFSKHIPCSQCRQLVEKLEGLSNDKFRSRVRHIRSMPENQPENKQLFYTIEILDEAISKHRQVEITYNGYGTDLKLHPHLNREGKPRRLVLNPYQIAASNGLYYLICNADSHDDVANYRVDRITDIKLLDTHAKPMRDVQGLEHGLDLPKHMAEHLYMYPGKSESVVFRAKKYLLNDLVDWFGKEIRFSNETADTVDCRVHVNLQAMRMWCMQYALHVEVLEPKELREQLEGDLRNALKQYKSKA